MPKRRARKPGNSRKYSFWRLLKIFLVLATIPTLLLTGVLIYYYYVFDRLIAAKLGNRYEITETEIFAAPRTIHPGKQITLVDFQAQLKHLGYVENGDPAAATSAFLAPNANRMMVKNGPSLPEDAGRMVDITWVGNKIRNIMEVSSGQTLERFSLAPELISNIINKNREKRRHVSYGDLPKVLINAVLASEDRRFFSHGGVDPIRILKALIIDIRAGDTVQGASTLTQQFVKNYFLTPERTWKRKLTDAYMSILLEAEVHQAGDFRIVCQ